MKSVTLTAQPSDQKNDYDALFDLNFDSTLEENPFIDLDPDASAAKEQQQQLSRKAASGLGPSGKDDRFLDNFEEKLKVPDRLDTFTFLKSSATHHRYLRAIAGTAALRVPDQEQPAGTHRPGPDVPARTG